MRASLLILLALCIATDSFAEKKDFKGLFGSYRREKYTENEGNETDFGVDLMLATALPVSTLVKVDATSTAPGDMANSALGTPVGSSAFFSGEIGFWMTLWYHWQLFANIGYYTYDSRLQNPSTSACAQMGNGACFTQYSMQVIPAVLGLKYRFGRSDIVPYIGGGAGLAYITRVGSYDYSPLSNTVYSTGLVAEGTAGLEFFISAKVGLRLEMSGMYLQLPALVYNSGGTASANPLIKYQANPLLIRYSSGLFILL
jgi:hypothetical protein